MSTWRISFHEYQPDDQPRREALCALGNGYFVTRGADESHRPHANGCHYPGTYLAGGYNRAKTHIAGRVIENEALVNFPSWLYITWRANGAAWFNIDDVEILDFNQHLLLKEGVFERTVRFRDQQGRTSVLTSQRFVSMRDQHLAALQWELTPEDWEGEIEIRSEIDGRIDNSGVARYSELNSDHFAVTSTAREDKDTVSLVAETHQSRLRVAMAARLRIEGAEQIERQYIDQGDRVGEEVTVRASRNHPVRVEKIVAVHTSRDRAIAEPRLEAAKAARRAGLFEELLASHRTSWARLWDRFDFFIDDDEQLRLLRLHVFHLLQVASPHAADLDVGVPARGWHGEAYRGHILWDELFIFPFLNLRAPDLTRALLMYRYRRLREARAAAESEGRGGARFPWQSGSNGREESQVLHLNPASGRWVPDNSQQQRHINIAIAYNVWHYYQCTGDVEFMASYGAELMIETARYMAELAEEGEDGRWHICGVMGPDEFHEGYPDADEPGIDDNAYTNLTTHWLLDRIPGVLAEMPEECRDELMHDVRLTSDELDAWHRIARNLYIPLTDDGIIGQFAGFTELEELPWDEYRERYEDIHRLDRVLEREGKSSNAYQITKQADVLMLFFLFSAEELEEMFDRLNYEFDPDLIPRNIRYYSQRTSHGSTLSRIVHAWVLARANRERSWNLFDEALRSDIDDIQGGTTPEGIHLGAMAGTVDLVHRCYAGVSVRDGRLHIHPLLPEGLGALRFNLNFLGRRLFLEITSRSLQLQPGDRWDPDTPVFVRGEPLRLEPDQTKTVDLSAGRQDESADNLTTAKTERT